MCCSLCSCLDVGLDGGLEGLGVCADNLGDLVTTLEQEECGHGADAEFLSDIRDLVDVELVEACLVVCVGEPGTALDARSLSGHTTKTYLTTWGAITLQGPHHVAKQSRTMRVSLSHMASSNAALLRFNSR